MFFAALLVGRRVLDRLLESINQMRRRRGESEVVVHQLAPTFADKAYAGSA